MNLLMIENDLLGELVYIQKTKGGRQYFVIDPVDATGTLATLKSYDRRCNLYLCLSDDRTVCFDGVVEMVTKRRKDDEIGFRLSGVKIYE